MTEFSEIFRGQYAVFSRMVPQAYLHDYVAMGGLIATTQDELEHVTFCICNDRFDTKFISIWYNGTFRVVSRTFIYDCAAEGRRMCEETYSWAGKLYQFPISPAVHAFHDPVDVDKDFEIVPTWSIHEWMGAILPRKPKRKVHSEPVEEVEVTECPPRRFSGGTGLLTPAPSFDRDARKKRKRTNP
ncbi:hypothetical protein MVEN_01439000 [Mycena venus]|uniref:BRCT domain-containing protein n=1 Tax=Mycena venus TaxID=2733690 RepID=A0A8H7CSX2_9AGAR|nr:hypothetical protein MVEN_01439000 [Mycena venus]